MGAAGSGQARGGRAMGKARDGAGVGQARDGAGVGRAGGGALTCRDLGVVLGRRPVLSGIDLEVAAGEWLGVIGPNGAGKTTLLRAIAGLVAHTGSVLLADGRRPAAADVAMVPQSPVVPEGMTVTEYALVGRTAHLGWLARESRRDRRVVAAVLRRLGLSGFASRLLSQLSGGEAQRVFVARALAQQAPVLLLDEPTSALDLGHQRTMLELIDELRRDRPSPDNPKPDATPQNGPGPGGPGPGGPGQDRWGLRRPGSGQPAPGRSGRGRSGSGRSAPGGLESARLGSRRLTVIAAMHDLANAARFADRLALIDSGSLAAVGAPAEVLDPETLSEVYATPLMVRTVNDELIVLPAPRSPGGPPARASSARASSARASSARATPAQTSSARATPAQTSSARGRRPALRNI